MVFALAAVALLSPSALAAKSAKASLLAFKGSYKGTFVVSAGGIPQFSGAAAISFVPAKSGKAAVLTILGPYSADGVTYNFGATFGLGKNGTMTVSDGILGFAPTLSFPTVGNYHSQGKRKILLTESVATGPTTSVQATGVLAISKSGKKNQKITANFLLTSGSTSFSMLFTGIGKAPKL